MFAFRKDANSLIPEIILHLFYRQIQGATFAQVSKKSIFKPKKGFFREMADLSTFYIGRSFAAGSGQGFYPSKAYQVLLLVLVLKQFPEVCVFSTGGL